LLKLNFIRVGARNNRESVALSEETGSTHGEITYHISEVTNLYMFCNGLLFIDGNQIIAGQERKRI
jgi:hypothetical protein